MAMSDNSRECTMSTAEALAEAFFHEVINRNENLIGKLGCSSQVDSPVLIFNTSSVLLLNFSFLIFRFPKKSV